MSAARLVLLARLVLAWNLLVILWGAVVRATGSGAGCGSHWPLCDGQVVPRADSVEQAIEFTHRATSGIALVAVVGFALLAFRARPAGHPVRRAAVAATVLIVVEALLGAGLVLFELVADDASLARAWAMAAHLVNTFLLLAALALGVHTAAGGGWPRLARAPRFARAWLATLGLLALAGASGAVAALGDTLFPARDLAHALEQDLAGTAHVLLRLRLAHPVLAAVAAAVVLLGGWKLALDGGPGHRAARAAAALALVQIVVGVVNVALLAPIPLQLAHLLLADLLWIAVVLAGARTLAED